MASLLYSHFQAEDSSESHSTTKGERSPWMVAAGWIFISLLVITFAKSPIESGTFQDAAEVADAVKTIDSKAAAKKSQRRKSEDQTHVRFEDPLSPPVPRSGR